MLRILAAILAVFLVGVGQSALSARLAGLPAPDLPLLLTVSLGLACGPAVGMAGGFGLALVQGGLAQSNLLAHALGLVPSGYLAGEVSRRFFREHWLVPIVSVLVLTLLTEGLFLLAASSSSSLPLRWLGLRVVCNGALALPSFWLVARARGLLASPSSVSG